MAQLFEREDKPNGAIQFILKESRAYQKGQYAIQMSYYRGKVYLHFQDNNNGKQMSLPDDLFDALYEQYFSMKVAVDEVRKQNQGPPSPQLLAVASRKKRRVVDLEEDDEF
uniref:Uncharacterized protein LOC111107143 n=1 Tax=Crassostrea virginica TaxID=6565 RepID=A0A8B8B465_CRAVI|nr:uncharacterized protein LOC111107143 [Crassostrea virginica]XP_022297864.1 uncharacterized protein LOC111107143 [Crassostrea virginica]